MTALEVLRLLLRSYDPKQFYGPSQQFAWYEAQRIVDAADLAAKVVNEVRR